MAARPLRHALARPLSRSVRLVALQTLAVIGLMAGQSTPAAAQSVEAEAAEGSPDTARPGPRAGGSAAADLPRPDAYPPPFARRNLLIAGAATTAGWYALALTSSYLWPDTVGAKDLRIPVAGPWIALSHSGCGHVADCSTVIVIVRAIATTLDAIGQASGLALAAEGLFLPTQEQAGPRRASAARSSSKTHVELRPTFDAGKNTVSFGVLGVF